MNESAPRTMTRIPVGPMLIDVQRVDLIKVGGGVLAAVTHERREVAYVPTDHTLRLLAEFSGLAEKQLKRDKAGFILLEGDAGAGKNFLVEYFAYQTGRTIAEFHCSGDITAQDLKSEPSLEGGRTMHRPSVVVRGIQQRNAIVLFDEINTLKPEVVKVLHSLFDHRRSIQWGEGQGETAQADPSVLLVATQNPPNYAGVRKLPETVVDRSRKMIVTYPPVGKMDRRGNIEKVFPDEAMMTLMLTDDFADYQTDPQKFARAWNSVVNQRGDGGVTGYQKKLMLATRDILVLMNRLRFVREDFLINRKGTPISVVFSIRMTKAAVGELGGLKDSNQIESAGGNVTLNRGQAALFAVAGAAARDERERRAILEIISKGL